MPVPAIESIANADGLLKEWYTDERIMNCVLGEGALYGLVRKMESFGGKRLTIPMIDGNPQGGSASITTAKANKTASSEVAYQLVRSKDYALAGIQREAKIASELGDKGAWLELAKVQIDGIVNTAARAQAVNIYGNATGIRGQISAGSNVATNSVTLADINSISNFETNMYIQTSATNGGTGTMVNPGQAQITGIDRARGILYFSGNLSTLMPAVAAGHYICRSGDYLLTMPGLQSWLLTPSQYPTALGQVSTFGVDVFPDVLRRAGCFHDGTGQAIEEAIIDGQSKAARDGAKLTHLFMNNVQYRQALKSLQGRVAYTHVVDSAQGPAGSVATVSFGGIQFMGDYGPIKVFADFNCPGQKVFGLSMPEVALYSAKAAPHIFDNETDQMWLRDANDDTYEVRAGSYSALGLKCPGHHTTIAVAAAT